MKQSLAALTDVVLRDKAGANVHQSCEEDETQTQQALSNDRDAQSATSSSTIPIAPIQAVRNMNSWITGQRPDGKQDPPVSSTSNLEVPVDELSILS